jgi:hypothetical protein
MLAVIRPDAPEALLDALAGLAAALQPGAGIASPCAVLGIARSRTRDVLRKLRRHFAEDFTAVGFREEGQGDLFPLLQSIERTQRSLARRLCGCLRGRGPGRGARRVPLAPGLFPGLLFAGRPRRQTFRGPRVGLPGFRSNS